MKVDPYHHERRYRRWKTQMEERLAGLSAASAETIRAFLADMEIGRNVGKGSQKGPRGCARLNNLRQRLVFITRLLEERYGVASLTATQDAHVLALFRAMRTGEIQRRKGGAYQSTGDYINVFKSYWHWHMTVERKRHNPIEDICVDLDYRDTKPEWVYLTEAQVVRLAHHAKYEYSVLMHFLFDSGIRSPTELVNIRVQDLSDDCKQLRIREEISKTFGRTIKLLRCHARVRAYIEEKALAPADQVFPISPPVANRYLQRLARRVLGDAQSPAGKRYSQLTMYAFRHASACYWLPRYPTESALKFRFGWKETDKIHYYTEFLGMRDTITEDHLLASDEKTAVERQLAQRDQENALLHEQLTALEAQQGATTHKASIDHSIVESLVEAKLQAILTKHGLVSASPLHRVPQQDRMP